MEALLLVRGWPGKFGRNVRDENGRILRRIEFEAGEPQWLEGPDLAAVQGDIGKALCYAELDRHGEPKNRPAKLQEPGGLDRLTGDGQAEPAAVEPVSGPNGDPTQNGEAEAKGRGTRKRS